MYHFNYTLKDVSRTNKGTTNIINNNHGNTIRNNKISNQIQTIIQINIQQDVI
jgi:hypothetical protein